MDSKLTRAALAEFVGTFMLVLIGCAAVTVGQTVVVPALAHGLTVISVAYTYGYLSGAHLNPAVTLGLLVGRHIKPLTAAVYIVVQFVAGIAAALVLSLLLGSSANLGETTGSLTSSNIVGAAIFEAILTFFLVSAVYQAAVFDRAGNLAPLAIGLTLVACILGGGPYTGASLNPARTLGPALIAGNLGYLLPYLIGIFGGGVLAGLFQQYVVRGK
jgi:MIP family channel proteins